MRDRECDGVHRRRAPTVQQRVAGMQVQVKGIGGSVALGLVSVLGTMPLGVSGRQGEPAKSVQQRWIGGWVLRPLPGSRELRP